VRARVFTVVSSNEHQGTLIVRNNWSANFIWVWVICEGDCDLSAGQHWVVVWW
jgi:hypothetical protein